MLCKGDRFEATLNGEYVTVSVVRVRRDGTAVVYLIPANGDNPIRALYRDGNIAYYPTNRGGKD